MKVCYSDESRLTSAFIYGSSIGNFKPARLSELLYWEKLEKTLLVSFLKQLEGRKSTLIDNVLIALCLKVIILSPQ